MNIIYRLIVTIFMPLLKHQSNLFLITLACVSLVLTIVIILLSGPQSLYTTDEIIGETLIDSEMPDPKVFPFFLKPITWIMILAVIGWYSVTELVKEKVWRLGRWARHLILMALLILAVISFYEVLYNFMVWGSLLALSPNGQLVNPDTAVNMSPADLYKINLVYATKVTVTTFACSVYGFMVFRMPEKRSSVA